MKEIEGNLITLALEGNFDVIAHGCNCMSTMDAGLAPQMAKAFSCDKFPMELHGKDINKLGTIDAQNRGIQIRYPGMLTTLPITKALTVVNAYTQYSYGRNHKDGVSSPVDYEAIKLCMRKMNLVFKGKHIGLPLIGAGLARGDWARIQNIIKEELVDCKVTIVHFKK
jgi:O-acetyl-ADP-ribose deacetylase (regulator of RNase III)